VIKTYNETEIRPFKAEDLLQIVGDGIKEKNVQLYGKQNLEELAQQTEDDNMSMTGIVHGKIAGCGGIRELWPGVGEVWMMLSPEVNNYPLRTGQIIINGMRALIEDNDFVRLQGWARIDFDKAHTVFRHLGFKAEGIAEKYTPDGCNCILYARTTE
jgi:hypothetical protein